MGSLLQAGRIDVGIVASVCKGPALRATAAGQGRGRPIAYVHGDQIALQRSEARLPILIELDEVKPRVWRRLWVPDTLTMAKLDRAIQAAIGCPNSQLHEFDVVGNPRR
jgi:hypothetical protein